MSDYGPEHDPRHPDSKLQGEIDYTGSLPMYRGPEGEWSVSAVRTPWSRPDADPLKDLNDFAAKARRNWLESPAPMIEQAKAGLSVPVSNQTKEEFYRKFGEALAVGITFTDEQLEWLETRHQEGKL